MLVTVTMVVVVVQMRADSVGRQKRAATALKSKLWPNATIPYVIGNVTGQCTSP